MSCSKQHCTNVADYLHYITNAAAGTHLIFKVIGRSLNISVVGGSALRGILSLRFVLWQDPKAGFGQFWCVFRLIIPRGRLTVVLRHRHFNTLQIGTVDLLWGFWFFTAVIFFVAVGRVVVLIRVHISVRDDIQLVAYVQSEPRKGKEKENNEKMLLLLGL